jgi:hypothetical protein
MRSISLKLVGVTTTVVLALPVAEAFATRIK